MTTFEAFNKNVPNQSMQLSDAPFTYRHYKNPKSKTTLVLLTGGIGLSDLTYLHFQEFAKHFSVITFDYQTPYKNNEQLARVLFELLTKLSIKVWFVGQSYGGFVAQIIAKKYPQVVEGLVLSNTGCLAKDMSQTANNSLMDMLKSSKKSMRILKLIPFSLFKKLVRIKILKKYTTNFTADEIKIISELCDIMDAVLTKPYELHMIQLLRDLENHFNMLPQDFTYLDKKVLLLLSEDDHTFHDEVKSALVNIMPKPKFITDLTGGHLSLMVNPSKYVQIIVDFIK